MWGNRDDFPPGPWNINAAIGLTWRHAVAYWWNPLTFFARMGRYGDMTFFRLFGRRGYLINRPDLICEVLINRRTDFAKWYHQMRPLRDLMGDSLLTSEGPRWVRQRQLMQRAFTQAAVSRYQNIAHELSEPTMAKWAEAENVDLAPLLLRLLMRINLASLFGISDDSVNEDLMWAIRSMSDVFQAEMFEPVPLPSWSPLNYKRKRKAATRILHQGLDLILASQRHSEIPHVGSVLHDAASSTSEDFTQEERRQEGITMMIAGFHTTSEMLLWVVRMLAKFPDVQHRARESCLNPSDEKSNNADEYLDRVIKESLRLFPAAWSLFARQAVEDTHLGGYPISKGSVLFIAPWVTHRDARYFPNPLQFDPDRFLPKNEANRVKGTYFPFGLGPHVCIGAATASNQVKAIVSSLLRRFRFEATDPGRRVKPSANLALRYDAALGVKLTRLDENAAEDGVPRRIAMNS